MRIIIPRPRERCVVRTTLEDHGQLVSQEAAAWLLCCVFAASCVLEAYARGSQL